MTYETRLQIGDYFITIDIEGNYRRGYGSAVFFQRAADLDAPRAAAVRHTVPGRCTTERKAHEAAFHFAAAAIGAGDVGL